MAVVVENINPKVLVWARETAHFGVEDIPKSTIGREKLIEIEAGRELPTLVQLEKLARKYERSLYTLMEQDIPEEDYVTLPFFRRQDKTVYDSALALFIRDIQRKQDWARNYLLSEGFDELDFIGSVNLHDSEKEVAKKIKARLELPSFSNFSRNDEYLKSIKDNLELNHIFVSITGSNKPNMGISLEDAQGFAVVDQIAPFIFVNTKNTTNAKIFTLIHEVTHLFINESGISEDSIKFRKALCHEDEVENFCNMVTSEVLMPEELFREKFNKTSNLILREKIAVLSKYFLVSELAVCVRLWRLKLLEYKIYADVYSKIQAEINEYLKEFRKKQKESDGGNYYAMMRSKNGNLLSQLAFYAYKDNKVLGTDLYNILKVKLDKLNTYFSAI
jgi:Zn-dependent peptidase ImmA (M78 family)